MTSFRRIFSLRYTFHTFKKTFTSASYSILDTNSNQNKLILTQSRCLFIKKSAKDTEAEVKRQHDLFQLNYLPKQTVKSTEKLKEAPPAQVCSSISDVIKKIQDGQLHYQSIRLYLLDMVKLYRQLRFSPEFSTEMDILKKSEEFEKFAQALEKLLPMASVKFLFLVFQAMHYYEIPCSSILMQKLHALILDNINKFELPEVIKMYLMIKNKNEILLEPLKNVFTAYMKHLTVENLNFVGDLKSLTYYAFNKEVPFSVREKILKKILSLELALGGLEPVMLVWLSKPLCSEDFQCLNKTHFLNALKKNMSCFQFKDLSIVLKNINDGIRKRVINYDINMFNIIANSAAKYDLRSASIIMNNLLRMGHVSYELADAIAEKLTKSDTNSLSLAEVEKVIQIFGLIDYKNYLQKISTDTWLELEKILKDYIKPETDFKGLETPLNLFILGLDTKEVVSKALTNFAKVLESQNEVPNISLRHARLLYQCHCAVYSSRPENVPKPILPDIKQLPSFGWKEAIYEAFNGEEYVLEKCKTPFEVLISFIVIMGPDLKPISLSSYKKSQRKSSDSIDELIDIENVPRPPGSKVFAFIEYTKEIIKFRNLPLLKLEPRLITNIHKNLGYRIFHLYLNQKKNSAEEYTKILSDIMTREMNYIAFKASESTAAEITNTI